MNKTIIPECKHDEKARDWSNLMIPKDLGIEIDHMMLVPKGLPAPLPPIVIDKDTLELKKLKVHLDMSEETICFSAEVWAQGRKVGHASNEGRGGGTMIHPESKGSLDAVEEWARKLPPESSYQRVYEAVLAVESTYTDKKVEDIKKEFWFSTHSVDLERIVDSIVNDAANRKGIRQLGAYAVFGPGKDTGDQPAVMKFKRKILPEWLVDARKNHKWAVLLTEFLDLPFHYYPSPHPFASGFSREPTIRHKPTGKVGNPYYRGTTDHQIVMEIGEREDNNWVTGKPEDFEFITEQAKVEEPATAAQES